jgi:hypothetical protein
MHKKVLYCVGIMSFLMFSAENSNSNNVLLSKQDSACFSWIEEKKKLINFKWSSLPQDAQDTFSERILHRDDPERVKKACESYATAFYEQLLLYRTPAHEMLSIPYSRDSIALLITKMTIIRQNNLAEPTDQLSARLFAFNQLSEDEQRTFHKSSYLQNPQATKEAVQKLGNIFAEQLAKIGLIENNPAAKAKAALEHFSKKMEDLKREYEQ